MGSLGGKTASRVGISSTVFGVRATDPMGGLVHGDCRDAADLRLRRRAPAERPGNTSNDVKDFRIAKFSSQGQNLAWTVSCVPNSLGCGLEQARARGRRGSKGRN